MKRIRALGRDDEFYEHQRPTFISSFFLTAFLSGLGAFGFLARRKPRSPCRDLAAPRGTARRGRCRIVARNDRSPAALDAATGDRLVDVSLAVPPEGFLPEPDGERFFVNDPGHARRRDRPAHVTGDSPLGSPGRQFSDCARRVRSSALRRQSDTGATPCSPGWSGLCRWSPPGRRKSRTALCGCAISCM